MHSPLDACRWGVDYEHDRHSSVVSAPSREQCKLNAIDSVNNENITRKYLIQ